MVQKHAIKSTILDLLLPSNRLYFMSYLYISVAVMSIAWYSQDRPFVVGYSDGKLLIGQKEALENGSVNILDAHKVACWI